MSDETRHEEATDVITGEAKDRDVETTDRTAADTHDEAHDDKSGKGRKLPPVVWSVVICALIGLAVFCVGRLIAPVFGGMDDASVREMTTRSQKIASRSSAASEQPATEESHDDVPSRNFYPEDLKPVIYLYPAAPTDVSVHLDRPDLITVSYPMYDGGWQVTARPDGSITDVKTGRSLYSLYYEADVPEDDTEKMDEGFVVARCDIAGFLEDSLAQIGLNDREAEEFIVYWLPRMGEHEFCYVRFALTDEEQERSAVLISPTPDHLIRVRMVWMGLDEPLEGVMKQNLPRVERNDLNGFVAVEWGGTEIK